MILKYRYGTPFETEAVVQDLPCTDGIPSVGTVSVTDEGFRFSYVMEDSEAAYGLGENIRGINKRGWHYISWNSDNPFHLENVVSLYGSHNFLVLSGKTTVGLFFDYPSKLEFDVGYTRHDLLTVSCDSANLYLYVITGENPDNVVKQFRTIIGRSYIPPKWAFGYGQSRWGYKTPDDFRKVANTYRSLDIPIDSVYMDIDYMDNYKDFTFNPENYPDPAAFSAEMREKNIRLVPIIDAGIKLEKGYDICDEGLEKGYFVTNADGRPFETACWPNRTYHPDFLQREAREWFGGKYQRLLDAGIEGFWNDMNEPALFYTKESIEKVHGQIKAIAETPICDVNHNDILGLGSQLNDNSVLSTFYHKVDGERVRHDKVHNLYGYLMTRAAGETFERLYPDKRILMYSRSSYIGMHRYGGIWQGDNMSWWSHLLLNLKMMPSLNMCGFLYTGADLGGFGSDTTRELMLRWLALGVFTPLMRNHSALGTREQECYQFEDVDAFRSVINTRYRLIPYLYSEYVKAALNNEMMFRPLAFAYPGDPIARETEDQMLLGDGVMIAPVYTQNAAGRTVYLPEEMLFVKFLPDGTLSTEVMGKGLHYISVALDEVPMFIRKGHAVPLAQPAPCVEQLDEENLELVGWSGAEYTLYRDDGFTKDYENPAHYVILKK